MGEKWSLEKITQFLDEYSKHPCLWNPSDPLYKNRTVRLDAEYEILKNLGIGNVDIRAFRNKVRIIRNTYNGEVSKIRRAQKSGTGVGYIPKLPWFHLADRFLKKAFNSQQSLTDLETPVCQEKLSLDAKVEKLASIVQTSPCTQQVPASTTRARSVQEMPTGSKRARLSREMDPCDVVLSLFRERLQSTLPEDQFDIIGKNVASKLRGVSREQRILAEKIINDVLFEAELGNLTRSCRLSMNEEQPANAKDSSYSTSSSASDIVVQTSAHTTFMQLSNVERN